MSILDGCNGTSSKSEFRLIPLIKNTLDNAWEAAESEKAVDLPQKAVDPMEKMIDSGEAGVVQLIMKNDPVINRYLADHVGKETVKSYLIKTYPEEKSVRVIELASSYRNSYYEALIICDSLLDQGKILTPYLMGFLLRTWLDREAHYEKDNIYAGEILIKASKSSKKDMFDYSVIYGLGESLVKRALDDLNGTKKKMARTAENILLGLGKIAVPFLMSALEGERKQAKGSKIADILNKIGDPILALGEILRISSAKNKNLRLKAFNILCQHAFHLDRNCGRRDWSGRWNFDYYFNYKDPFRPEMKFGFKYEVYGARRILIDALKEGNFSSRFKEWIKDSKRSPYRRKGGWSVLDEAVLALFPYLNNACVSADPVLNREAKDALKAAKFRIKDHLSSIRDRNLSLKILAEIEKATRKTIIIEQLVKIPQSEMHRRARARTRNTYVYDLILRILKMPEGVDYARLIFVDPQGKAFRQNCDDWGDANCWVKLGLNKFRVFLNRKDRRVKAYLRYYDSKSKYIGRSRMRTIYNPHYRP